MTRLDVFSLRCQINEAQKLREKKPERRTKQMAQDKGEYVDVDGDTKEQDIPRSPEVELKTMVDHDQTERSTTQPDGALCQPGRHLHGSLSTR